MDNKEKIKTLLKATIKEYGKKKGTRIAYAIANKRGWLETPKSWARKEARGWN